MGDGIPEGLSLDDKGELVGHVDMIKSFKKKNPFFFGATGGGTGNQGGSNGSDTKGKIKPGDKKTEAYERGKKAVNDTLKPFFG